MGGGGGRIFLIDAPTSLAVLRMVQAHAGPVTALTATAVGVVSGGGDGAVKVWRKTPGKNEVELVHTYSFGGSLATAGAAAAAVRGPGEASTAMAAIMTGAPKRQSATALPKALRNTGPADRDAKVGGKKASAGAAGPVRAIALLHAGGGGGGGGGGGEGGGEGGEGGEGGGTAWPVILVGTGRCSIWELGDTRGATEILAVP